MGIFSRKKNKLVEAFKRNAERESKMAMVESDSVDVDYEEVEDEFMDDDEPYEINDLSVQYKALVSRLEKYDNERTDAVRMALLYLESSGKISVNSLDKFLKG